MTADTYQAKAIQVIRNLLAAITAYSDESFEDLDEDAQDANTESMAAGEQFVDEIID